MVTLATFIGLPVSIPLGAVSLAGVGISGMAMVLTKKYQKKLSKVTTLTDIIMSALAIFERVVSKALKNGKIDEEEFKVQDAQEWNDPEKVSSRWVKHLYGFVDELNDTETDMIGIKPSDAIKLNQVPLVDRENYPPEDTLPEDGLYHYLLKPGEEHDDQWHRSMEQWSKKTYRLREIVEDSGNHVMYYLKDGPERAFVSEELMLILEDTELPPDYVQNW